MEKHPRPTDSNANAPQPYSTDPFTFPQRARRRRHVVVSLIALLMAALLTVCSVLVFLNPYRLTGNPGVVAAFEYFRSYARQSKKAGSRIGQEAFARLAEEPFEIDCGLNIASDQFETLGVPLHSIPLDFEVKYDLIDLGIKIKAMGIEAVGAYVINDDFVLDIGGFTGSAPIDAATDTDLSESMGLVQRIAAFFPFLVEDHTALYMKVLQVLAQSVPDKYTDTYTLWVYSHTAQKDVKTVVTETSLDAGAITRVIGGFARRLRDDEALCEEIQALFDEVTDCLGMDDVDLDDIIDQLRGIDESDLTGMALSWEVYQRQGCYNGLSVTFQPSGDETVTLLSEFSGNVFYTSECVSTPYVTTETWSKMICDGNRADTESKTTTTSEYMSETMVQTVSVEYSRISRDEYAADLDMNMEIAYAYSDDQSDNMSAAYLDDMAITVNVLGDMEFRFGSNLKPLKESFGWKNIYKEDWESLQDIFDGLFPFSILAGDLSNL